MADRIQLRRDTKANWETYNPILLEGEPGHVLDDPNLYKMGDGVHTWNQLPYRGYNGTVVQDIKSGVTNSVPSADVVYKFVKGFTMEQGGFDASTGAEAARNNRIRSSYIRVNGTFTLEINDGYQAMVYRYDTSKVHVGHDSSFFTSQRIYKDAFNGYIRILIGKSPDDTQRIVPNDDYDISLYKTWDLNDKIFFTPISFSTGGGFTINNNKLSILGSIYIYISKNKRISITENVFGEKDLSTTSGFQKLIYDATNSVFKITENNMADDIGENEYLLAYIEYNGTLYYMSTAGMVGVDRINIMQDVKAGITKFPTSAKAVYKIAKGFAIEKGGFNSTTGEENNATNILKIRLRSNYIRIKGTFTLEINEGYQAMVYRYDTNKTYVNHDSSFFTGQKVYDDYFDGYIRILIGKYPDDTQEIDLNGDYDVLLYKTWRQNDIFYTPISFAGNGNFIIENDHLSISGNIYIYVQRDARINLSPTAFGSLDLALSTAGGYKKVILYNNYTSVKITEMDYQLGNKELLLGFVNYNNGLYYMSTAGMVGVDKINQKKIDALSPVIPIKNDSIRYFCHRGVFDSNIPEETIYGVMYAAVYGHKYIEADVIYTSDGEAVMMHDYTINRTMRNADGTEISEQININEHTLAELQVYRYKSDNPKFRTKICTLEEYVNACVTFGVIPIIQTDAGSNKELNLRDTTLLCNKLGANWIQYNGNPMILRQVSNDVLFLDSSVQYSNYATIINKFRTIGGRCGVSYIPYSNFVNYASTRKQVRASGYEVQVSIAGEMGYVPDAILEGATIVLADNIGKDVSDIEASNLVDFSAFTHDGTITNGVLELGENERLTYPLSKDGNYTVIINTEGTGSIRMPKAHTAFLDINITKDGYFKFPILFTTQNADRNLIINGSSSGLSIKEILIMYSKN